MKAPPPRFADDYLPALLAQASLLISSEFHVIARQEGFSVSEWRVMGSLAGGQALSIGQLAQISVTKQPTVTRLLDRMEAQGLVERLPHESDRRVTLVRLTRSGSAKLQRLIELAKEHEYRVMEPFGLTRAEELKDTLHQLIRMHAHVVGTDRADEE